MLLHSASDNVLRLVSNIASNAINKFERKLSGRGAFREEKIFSLFISNEDLNDIIKIIKSLKDLGVLIDAVTEIVKHEIKKQEGRFFGSFVSTFSRFVSATSNLLKGKSYKWKRI